MSVYEELSTLVQQGRANNVKDIIAAELEKGTKLSLIHIFSGTGALAGIYKAYEDMTGTTLSEAAKDTAVEELIVTGELQDALGDVSSLSLIHI